MGKRPFFYSCLSTFFEAFSIQFTKIRKNLTNFRNSAYHMSSLLLLKGLILTYMCLLHFP